MNDLDEMVKEFLVESLENLDQLDRDLVLLEVDSGNPEIINRIFRTVHTIKGTCGFFALAKLEKVSHVGENLLDNLRSGKVSVSQEIISALLRLGDTLRSMLLTVEQTGSDGDNDNEELIRVLTLLNRSAPKTGQLGSPEVTKDKPLVSEDSMVVALMEQMASKPDGSNDPTQSVEDELELLFAEEQARFNQREAETDSSVQEEKNKQQQSPESGAIQFINSPPVDESKKSELSETALRVDVHLLDKLMNLVGELVLARNQILQFTKNQNDSELVSTSQRLNLITSELQEGVMRTRMQPIANVWNKLPRIVRDVAQSCGKQVRLEMSGKETELDKTIIEAIKDPLTHIIRNSVDHGVETPEQRKLKGKDAEGVLSMKAYHEGGQVIIEIRDDGAGLNVQRIRSKALEKGLIGAEKVASMSEHELQRLVFLPGLSTAEKITNVSGRGVGMDVVKSNIERIGGTVDVASIPEKGTTFIIKIPLTLAIIPALVVSAAGNRYAIPQVNLLELVRIDGDEFDSSVEDIQGSLFYRLRGRLLPLVFLSKELGLTTMKEIQMSDAALSVVVVRADGHQFGLVVDIIHDTEEIVVKPLGKLLKAISSFAGTTIMGDGQVALILDVVGIARRANVSKGKDDAAEKQEAATSAAQADKLKLLLFELNDKQRAAIPLTQVNRLEEFDVDKLERSGGFTVVQYRDGILPLIDLNEVLSGAQPQYEGTVRAFVYHCGTHLLGFTVRRIVDIIEQEVEISSPFKRRGLIGSAVIQERVTDIVDIGSIAQNADFNIDQSHSKGGIL